MVKILENYEIKNETTFKIGGIVKKTAFPQSYNELLELLKSEEYDLILGNCSNVLFSSNKIDKNIIITKAFDKYLIDNNRIKISVGTKGSIIANECLKRNLSGFEFLSGFPGSFGGMIYMNASAHNQSISDTFVSAKVYDLENKEVKIIEKCEMGFSYRHSNLQNGKFVLLEAEFELNESSFEKIQETMRRNLEFRKSKQPLLKYGNAGSIFKNPLGDSAGRLLDLCSMKGQKEGGAMVFENHANFIINFDNASSFDVIKLMFKMFSKVKEKYTIELKPEIKYIGNKGTKEYELWKIMDSENMQMIQE